MTVTTDHYSVDEDNNGGGGSYDKSLTLPLYYFFKQEFQRGAGDSHTVVKQDLPVPISARYIRFNPTKRHNWNCLRVEVYGNA